MGGHSNMLVGQKVHKLSREEAGYGKTIFLLDGKWSWSLLWTQMALDAARIGKDIFLKSHFVHLIQVCGEIGKVRNHTLLFVFEDDKGKPSNAKSAVFFNIVQTGGGSNPCSKTML